MKPPIADVRAKIQAGHLERAAYVYVRQSSPYQVEHHQESTRLQYDFVTWAIETGWPQERIVVVDEDQARTATLPYSRAGFERLAEAVGRSEVGIVISLEVSRLARNSPDWHHLLHLCRWTNTRVADRNAVYDLSLPADRMVLGLRGQMSEMEMDHSIQRMVEARWNKARRGEAFTLPPPGYEVDEAGQLILTADEAVAQAIRSVFVKFDELGSARQVVLWWREQGLGFPVRRVTGRTHPVVWAPPAYRRILQVLRHPIYAGAYVFGRSGAVRELDPDDPRKLRVRRVARPDWPVLIRDHHAPYIPFEKYLQNQERLRGNIMMRRGGEADRPGAAREGDALLQGLVRCGRCGRAMNVSYGGHRSKTSHRTMQYRCLALRRGVAGGECQTIGGMRIDQAVVEAFLEATRPAGVEAVRKAEEEGVRERDAAQRCWQLQVEKAEYEAGRAERQFQAVEPENRIVARELERRWEVRLKDLEAVRAQAEKARERESPLSEAELDRARKLGADLEAIWTAETTTNRDRKRLLRCVVEEVQLRAESEHYQVRLVWKGGAITDREVIRRRLRAAQATPEETVELVRRLAAEFDDAQVARILNKQGRRTGPGNPFTKANVCSMRGRHGILRGETKRARDPREGPFTADEAARELGVCMSTVHRWLRVGVLAGRQVTPGAPWQIVLGEEVRRRLSGAEAPAGWVGLTEASRQTGWSKARVAHLVHSGKLPAVRVQVGKRQCWRIDVGPRTCKRQPDLFDQMSNDAPEEA